MPDWSRRKFLSCAFVLDRVVAAIWVTNHALHKAYETPECYGVILHNRVDGCQQITHALDIA